MDVTYCVAFAIVSLAFIYFYSTKKFKYWEKQNIASVTGAIPLFGNALSVLLMKENLSMKCNAIYKNHAKEKCNMIGMYLMQTPMLILCDPELIKSVLTKDFQSFHNNMLNLSETNDPFMAKNPFFATDDSWKTIRSYLVRSMSAKKLKVLFLIIHRTMLKCEKYLDNLIVDDQGLKLELRDFTIKFTGEVVANTALGIEGQSFEANRDKDCFTVQLEHFLQPSCTNGISQILNFYLPGFAHQLRIPFMPYKLSNFLINTIKNVVRYRADNNIVMDDYLNMAIEGQDEPDINAIVSHVSAYFFDAYETTGTITSFACYYLAYDAKVQEKARKHIKEILKKHDGNVNFESLKDMTYLEQIVNETIRLQPILGVSIKSCTQKITLQSSDGESVRLEKGDVVAIPVLSIHTDPKYWQDPLVFDPDRFNEDRKSEVIKFAFLPFSEGPRMCPGRNYAMLMTKTIIVAILTKYVIEGLHEKMPPIKLDERSILTSPEKGLWVRVKKISEKH